MGLFERLYGYRIENLVTNDKIRTTKLEDEAVASYWIDFIELWRAVESTHVKRRGSGRRLEWDRHDFVQCRLWKAPG